MTNQLKKFNRGCARNSKTQRSRRNHMHPGYVCSGSETNQWRGETKTCRWKRLQKKYDIKFISITKQNAIGLALSLNLTLN